jgi:hypothetical protein
MSYRDVPSRVKRGRARDNVIEFSGRAQFVIPAQAGIQADGWFRVTSLDSRVRGNDVRHFDLSQ